MSAEHTWRQDKPKENDKPVVQQAILSWMQTEGRPEIFVPPQAPEPVAVAPPVPAPSATEEDAETLVALLNAIQGTELAARLQSATRPGNGYRRPPAVATEPAKISEAPFTLQPSTPNLTTDETSQPADTLKTADGAAAVRQQNGTAPPSVIALNTAPREPATDNLSFAFVVEAAPPGEGPQAEPDIAPVPDLPAAARPRRAAEPLRTNEQLTIFLAPMVPDPSESVPDKARQQVLPTFTPPSTIASPEAAEGEAPLLVLLSPMLPSPLPWIPAADETTEAAAGVEPAPIPDGSPRPPILSRLGGEIKRVASKVGQAMERIDRAELGVETRLLEWFGPQDPRRTPRMAAPPLVAYHWIMNAGQELKIADISAGGLYLLTDDRWSEGNIISMTLQRTDMEKGAPESWIAVDFVVTRWCDEGLAGAFIPARPGTSFAAAGRAENCADKRALERFVKRLADPAEEEPPQ